MKLWPFSGARAAPTPSDAARTLSLLGHAQERERVKAVARQLCREMGKAVPSALEPGR